MKYVNWHIFNLKGIIFEIFDQVAGHLFVI
jgi:hypothetical protein